MIINTKFDIGDEIYYKFGKGISKSEVEAISITFTKDIAKEDIAISYRTRNGRIPQQDAMYKEEAISALVDIYADEIKELFGRVEKEGGG